MHIDYDTSLVQGGKCTNNKYRGLCVTSKLIILHASTGGCSHLEGKVCLEKHGVINGGHMIEVFNFSLSVSMCYSTKLTGGVLKPIKQAS